LIKMCLQDDFKSWQERGVGSIGQVER